MGSAQGSGQFAAPAELRARVFTLLAEGADGLLYRHDWNSDLPAARALAGAIPGLNAEVTALSPWLTIGAPGKTLVLPHRTGIRLSTRFAGEKGMLVFLVRDDHAGNGKRIIASPSSVDDLQAAGLDNLPEDIVTPGVITIRTALPKWCHPESIRLLRGGKWFPVADAHFAEATAEWTASIPEAADVYVIDFAPPSVGGMRGAP